MESSLKADRPSSPCDDGRARKFRRIEQHEHVLKRGTMYVGSCTMAAVPCWVLRGEGEKERAAREPVPHVPALYKLYDEVVTNAADQAAKDPTLRNISITVTEDSISCWNDGVGIPVVVKDGMWVPEMMFGHLNSSSNYDDSEEKLGVAGQNGLGVKLSNIFSDDFTVEVCDSVTGTTIRKKWHDNMRRSGEAVIEHSAQPRPGFVHVTFKPTRDFMAPAGAITEPIVAMFARRALDIALAVGPQVSVKFNNRLLKAPSLEAYARMFVGDALVAVDDASPHWRVALALSGPEHGHEVLLSTVNGVPALGSHVEHVVTKLHNAIKAAAKSKREFKSLALSRPAFRAHITLFLAARVNAPRFSSQTKEKCTDYEPMEEYKPSPSFIQKVLASDLLKNMAAEERDKAKHKSLHAGDGKKTRTVNVPKLRDAVLAGGAKSRECVLILTEGDSATTFAVAALGDLGHDRYGVFTLRGKLLNVDEANDAKLAKNAEIKNIKTALGLRAGEDSAANLRYGAVWILTDADVDGAHIRGLLLNFFNATWPTLAKSGFLHVVPTPIIRVTRGKSVRSFYDMDSYNTWAAQNPSGGRTKYYKGLGAWSSADAKEIFKQTKAVRFVDGPGADDAIALAFKKKGRADDRKGWLLGHIAAPPPPVDYTCDVPINVFVDRDMSRFAVYNTARNVPSALDGLKPSQRKIMYTVFKNKYFDLAHEVKVAQLSGATSALTNYMHGEESLNDAIVKLAQPFAGSNNMPLLVGDGQFGTRLQNGRDAASARYIFCYASAASRALIRAEDEPLLSYRVEEGDTVEPVAYFPVLPLVLINGAFGIGSAFSTSVPPHAPADVLAGARAWLAGEEVPARWYPTTTASPAPWSGWVRGPSRSRAWPPSRTPMAA